jgi:hypothetical protein
VVRLDAEERDRLNELIRKGKRSAQLLTKARILLKADISDAGEGWSDSRIAAALDTSIATVERTRRQLVEEGFEAVLARKYNANSAPRRIFDGAAEAKLIALTLSPALEGFARWSLRLLEEKVVELHIVERASDNTIGRTLKKYALQDLRGAEFRRLLRLAHDEGLGHTGCGGLGNRKVASDRCGMRRQNSKYGTCDAALTHKRLPTFSKSSFDPNRNKSNHDRACLFYV